VVKIAKTKCSEEIIGSLSNCADDGLKILNIHKSAGPKQIIAAINDFIINWQKNGNHDFKSRVYDEYLASLASLWGNQLNKALDWKWGHAKFDGQEKGKLGVFSPDNSLVIYPLDYTSKVMLNANIPPTVLLAFNLIQAQDFSSVPPDTFHDVMASVRHIVPPA